MLKSFTPFDEVDGWPPVFQDYEEYKRELDEAISIHPPFGEWLAKYRTINHVLNQNTFSHPTVLPIFDRGDRCMWKLSVDELKTRYTREMTVKTAIQNGRRLFAEVHMAQNADVYKEAEATFVAAQDAYAFALEKYTEVKSHGYKTPVPKPPVRNYLLQQKDAILKIEIENLTEVNLN